MEITINRRRFRQLLIAEWCLAVAIVPFSIWSEKYLPPPLRQYMDTIESAPFSTTDAVMTAFGFAFLAFAVVVTVGLYRFRRWSRPALLISTVLGLVVQAIYGPYVESGVSSALDDALVLLGGIIMALVFTHPVKGYFESDHEV